MIVDHVIISLVLAKNLSPLKGDENIALNIP